MQTALPSTANSPTAPPAASWLYSPADEAIFTELWNQVPLSGPIVRLRPLALGGRWIGIRPGTTDILAFERAFSGGLSASRQSPPIALASPAHKQLTILDLGCNVGYSTAALLEAHPAARVIGVDIDPRNIEQARRELAPFGPRVQLLSLGIWGATGTVGFAGLDGWSRAIDGLSAYANCPPRQRSGTAEATIIPDLLDRLSIDRLDYLHMDITGSEAAVFDLPREWLRRISCIKVHVNPPAEVARVAWRISEQGLIVLSPGRAPGDEPSRSVAVVTAVCKEWNAMLPRWPKPQTTLDPSPGPW